MTTRCIETDRLVALGAALGWEDLDLSHLIECRSCQDRIDGLRTLKDVLDLELEPRSQFANEVVRSLAVGETSVRRTRGSLRVLDLVNSILAGITVLFAIAFVAGGDTVMRLGPALLLGPIIVAAGTLWWNRRHGSGVAESHS